MSTKVVTGKARFSFCHLFEPQAPQGGGEPKYSVTLLIPKSDTATLNKIKAAQAEARENFCKKNGASALPAKPNHTLHDGDGEMPNGGDYGEFTQIPGTDTYVYFAHTGDNLGPQSAAEIFGVYDAIREKYPEATVCAGDLSDVAAAVETVRASLMEPKCRAASILGGTVIRRRRFWFRAEAATSGAKGRSVMCSRTVSSSSIPMWKRSSPSMPDLR